MTNETQPITEQPESAERSFRSETIQNGVNRNSTDRGRYQQSMQRSEANNSIDRSEGELTKMIETATSQVPSGVFLTLAIGAMGMSAAFQAMGEKHNALFVGQWVPAILIMGLYNKMVKLHGSEQR